MVRLGVLLVLILLSGCGTMPEKVTISGCMFPNSNDMAPSWVCDAALEGLVMAEAGMSVKQVEGPKLMRADAFLDAREKLAIKIMVRLQQVLQKSPDIEVTDEQFLQMFEGVVSAEKLSDARIYTSRNAPDGSLHVLVGYEEGRLRETLTRLIEESMTQQAPLWGMLQDKAAREFNDVLVQEFIVMLK